MADAADKAASDEERAMALFEEQRQQRIAASFKTREPGTLLNCVDCSEEIPAEREAAYPRTCRCVSCAAEVERSYRRGMPT